MRQAFMGFLYFCICLSNPLIAFHNSSALAADGRYVLKEFTMNGCPACVAALEDVRELTAAGVDVQCFNTDNEPQAAAECRKNYLKLRPAWRLTRTSDGAEVGRWYGAKRAGIIIATIRAKFPTPDAVIEETFIEESQSEEQGETPLESETPQNLPEKGDSLTLPGDVEEDATPSPVPGYEERDEPPVDTLAQIDAELGEAQDEEEPEDFRDRRPVAETFEDVGFLNDSLDEWEERNDEREEPTPEPQPDDDLLAPNFRKEGTPTEPNDARLGDRLTDRAAQHILEGVLCKIDEVKKDAFAKFDEIGGRATDRLEGRVQKEFEGAKALIERRIDDALRDAKNEIRKQIGDVIKKTIITILKSIVLLTAVGIVCWTLWKASGVAKKIAGV